MQKVRVGKKGTIQWLLRQKNGNDEFEWLEDGSSEQTLRWVKEQNDQARQFLDRIPGRDELRRAFEDMYGGDSSEQEFTKKSGARVRHFKYARADGQNHNVLYYKDDNERNWKVALDPNTFSGDGTVALAWANISDDGSKIAYGVMQSGGDRVSIRVLDLDSQVLLKDEIPPIRYPGLVWKADMSGFYYTRYPDPKVREDDGAYHICFHALGTDFRDDVGIFGKGLSPEKSSGFVLSGDNRSMVISVEEGSKTDLYYKDMTGKNSAPVLLTSGIEASFIVLDIVGKTVIAMTNYNAPNSRVISFNIDKPDPKSWKEVIPELTDIMESAEVHGRHIVVNYLRQASSAVKIYSLEGQFEKEIKFPIGSVSAPTISSDDDVLFFHFDSYIIPSRTYKYTISTGKRDLVRDRAPKYNYDFKDLEVEQVSYPSKDGTLVSAFIVHKKGMKLDGTNPTVLYGYGGFGISETPSFDPFIMPFLEKGGVYVVANLRGGGEYGEDWHLGGVREKKQNVFDDFISAAEWLIKSGYTSSDKLAIMGGSNGGLLVGAVMVQRPDLFKAVICSAPLLDMAKFHRFGGGKLWIAEYGDPDSKSDLKYLLKYSPYHNVRDGERYPAVLFMSADNDDRVDPMHARKMAALLQAAAAPGGIILLRTEAKAGHGAGKPLSKWIDEAVDEWSFLFQQLGMLDSKDASMQKAAQAVAMLARK